MFCVRACVCDHRTLYTNKMLRTGTVALLLSASAILAFPMDHNKKSHLSASSACAKLYGQCGGLYWDGPTCCVEGTCKPQKGNKYYSQCLASGPAPPAKDR